jgi:aromatic ring hydroxylase
VEYIGTSQFQNVREELADVIRYMETLKAFIRAAEADTITTRAGLAMPNPKSLMIAHMYAIEHHPRLLQTVLSLSGQSILMSPTQADLESAALSTYFERYTKDSHTAEDKSRLFRLAWDLAGSSFAGRQLLFETFNARNLIKNRLDFMQGYDTTPFKEAAKRMAGIRPTEEQD